MPIHNFMLADLAAVALGFILFGLFVFVPGYVVGWLADLFGFRRVGIPWKIALSIPLSVALLPILVYLAGRFFSMAAVWCLCGAFWLAFLILISRFKKASGTLARLFTDRSRLIFPAIAIAWIALGAILLIDLQFGDRLYFSTIAYDYCLRTALTDSISRTGIPPLNPLFDPGQPAPLRYHYFWLILCSLTDQLGGPAVSPRQAMLAGTMWCGIALMSLVFVYLRFYQGAEERYFRRKALAGIGLLSVTGLDLLPVMLILAVVRTVLPSVEWWNSPVMAWVHAVQWLPHHVAGLVACLTGVLVLWRSPMAKGIFGAVLGGVIAALALASAFGMSVYVTFVCAVFLAVWGLITIGKGWLREALLLALTGLLTLLLLMPYLADLQTKGSGGSLFVFEVRHFVGTSIVLGSDGGPQWLRTVLEAVFLPLNYFLELGFFFVIGFLWFRDRIRRREALTRQDLFGMTMVSVSLLTCSFLRSGVITNNDLGWRGTLLAQFVLLIWAADAVDLWWGSSPAPDFSPSTFRPASSGPGLFLRFLLVVGLAGSLYEVVIARFFPVLSDTGQINRYAWLARDTNLGARTCALRSIYEGLDRSLPRTAKVQHNPDTNPNDLFSGLYANRQVVADTKGCGAVFGGDPAACGPIYARLEDLFTRRTSDPDAVCRDLSIDVLVVKDTDPVWKQRESWVWNRKPLIANEFGRALACGGSVRMHTGS